MHITASCYVNDLEYGLHHDIMTWLEKLVPFYGVTVGRGRNTTITAWWRTGMPIVRQLQERGAPGGRGQGGRAAGEGATIGGELGVERLGDLVEPTAFALSE